MLPPCIGKFLLVLFACLQPWQILQLLEESLSKAPTVWFYVVSLSFFSFFSFFPFFPIDLIHRTKGLWIQYSTGHNHLYLLELVSILRFDAEVCCVDSI